MPLSITCNGCGKRLKANERLLGRTVPCPACAAPVFIGSAEDAAAALLLDDAAPTQPEPAEPEATREAVTTVQRSEPERARLAPPSATPRGEEPLKAAVERTPLAGLPPLTANEPPFWLRHLHWLLVLSLIPLAVQLLQTPDQRDLLTRIDETVAHLPDSQRRVDAAIEDLLNGKGSLDRVFSLLPDHKLRGALLPRDTWAHWLFTGGATLVFLAFMLALSMEGTAKAQHLLLVGLFTATGGVLFLLVVQFAAAWSQGMVFVPRSVVGIFIWIVQLIGYSYRMAADPDVGFFVSFLGYTFGVGLCEELCKALPILVQYFRPNDQSWKGAFLWGLASGAGFGLSEGVMYAGDYYNGITGLDIYLVRNLSCVALHALWTGSAAITIQQKQHWFQDELTWYELLLRAVGVVAVPMVLHGLYDTLLKKDLSGLALGVALLSFGYLAMQISLLRGVDDQAAHEEMLREYKRRRKAMQRM